MCVCVSVCVGGGSASQICVTQPDHACGCSGTVGSSKAFYAMNTIESNSRSQDHIRIEPLYKCNVLRYHNVINRYIQHTCGTLPWLCQEFGDPTLVRKSFQAGKHQMTITAD